MLDDIVGSVLSVVGVPERREGPRGSAGRRRDRTRFRLRLRLHEGEPVDAVPLLRPAWRTFVLDVHDNGIVACRRPGPRRWHSVPYAGLSMHQARPGRGWRERHRIVVPVRLAGGGTIDTAVWAGDTGLLARALARTGAAVTVAER